MKTKHLLSGVAILAGVTTIAAAQAQGPAPSGRSYGGFSGDNPNPGQGPMATTPAWEHAAPAANSAMPPAHHAVRHANAMHAFHRQMSQQAGQAGDTTGELNRAELARIQSGAPPSPPPSPR